MAKRITDAQLSNAAALVRRSMLDDLAQNEMDEYEFSEAFHINMKNIVEHGFNRKKTIWKSDAKPKRILVIAAIIAAMTMLVGYTALSGADWFRHFFQEQLQQPLSPAQSEYIGQSTMELNQSVTVNGYTLTIEYAIADSRNAYIKLRLDGPVNEPLDAGLYTSNLRKLPDGSGFEQQFFKADDPSLSYGAGSWEMLEDGNPNDNSVSILWSLHQAGADLPSFEEDVLYQIHLTDWVVIYDDERPLKPIAGDGTFDFYITFQNLNQDVLNLISSPVATAYNDFAVEITAFQLNTMSGSATYTGREDEKGVICLAYSIVKLKNGTEVTVKPRRFGTGFCDFTLSSPIVLSDVEYVQLRDGTKLYPQEQE